MTVSLINRSTVKHGGNSREAFRNAKHKYKEHIEDQFTTTACAACGGLKALTDYKAIIMLPSDDAKLPDVFNQFFACFEAFITSSCSNMF